MAIKSKNIRSTVNKVKVRPTKSVFISITYKNKIYKTQVMFVCGMILPVNVLTTKPIEIPHTKLIVQEKMHCPCLPSCHLCPLNNIVQFLVAISNILIHAISHNYVIEE